MTTDPFTLWVPKATGWLNSNKVVRNHGHRNALVQAWKTAGWQVAQDAPKIQKARIIAHLVKNPGGGRWDPNNWYPTAKAVVDGFVRAGMLPDDDWKHLIGPDMRYAGTSIDDPGLRIEVIPLDATRPATETPLAA